MEQYSKHLLMLLVTFYGYKSTVVSNPQLLISCEVYHLKEIYTYIYCGHIRMTVIHNECFHKKNDSTAPKITALIRLKNGGREVCKYLLLKHKSKHTI